MTSQSSCSLQLNENLLKLPALDIQNLCVVLNQKDAWKLLIRALPSTYQPNNIAYLQTQPNPAEALILQLGNSEMTLLSLMQAMDRAKLEDAQLVLKRKFQPVKFTRQPTTPPIDDNSNETTRTLLTLQCQALAFPYPQYQWFKDSSPMPGKTSASLLVPRCELHGNGVYRCLVWNEIPDREEFASLRRSGKHVRSEQFSDEVTVNIDGTGEKFLCPLCSSEDEKVISPVFATDKVALIICNAQYEHLPPLITPGRDAETLSEGLSLQGFKTVTLCDLNLSEMRAILVEYCHLLGTGVYAVFYFVGHGCEAGGQCYMLPVDTPRGQYHCTNCLCAEEVLSMMQETDPACNMILLDMCRRYPPEDIERFTQGAVQFKPRSRRNTVFGFATSYGEGAYEVRGEENGVFMKYLKKYLVEKKPITDVLNSVLSDVAQDPKASEAQFPEVRTDLSMPNRGLGDTMNWAGHTKTYDHRTTLWQTIHELPPPTRIPFPDLKIIVRIFFDYCGPYVNLALMYSQVHWISDASSTMDNAGPACLIEEQRPPYIAQLRVPKAVRGITSVVSTEQHGLMVQARLIGLQKLQSALYGIIDLYHRKSQERIASQKCMLAPYILISVLGQGQLTEDDMNY